MRALVTGATGFVGAAVARVLLAEGLEVRVLARPSSERRNLAGLDAEIVEGDLTVPASLAAAMRDCDAVFHVAAEYRLWAPDPSTLYRNNVEGSLNVVEAARGAGVGRLVYTSSVAALGTRTDGGAADETTPVGLEDMIGAYKRSKYQAEHAVLERSQALGLATVVVNPSTPLGPGDIRPTPTGRVILDAVRGRMPAFIDTGLNIVHVEDVARGHWLALERGTPGERYILGGEDLSLEQILETVAQLTGRPRPWGPVPRWPLYPLAYLVEAWARLTGGEPQLTVDALKMAGKHMYFSSEKAQRVLGYHPRPATEAIAAAVEWFSRAEFRDHA